MSDGYSARDAAGNVVPILTDEVTDATLGTGQKQLIGIVDATINGTNKLKVDAAGAALVKEIRSSAVTQTPVAATTASATYIASNANRIGATIFNDTAVVLYVSLNGVAASATNCLVQVAPGGYYEIPFGFTGDVRCVLASGTGTVRVAEFV